MKVARRNFEKVLAEKINIAFLKGNADKPIKSL